MKSLSDLYKEKFEETWGHKIEGPNRLWYNEQKR